MFQTVDQLTFHQDALNDVFSTRDFPTLPPVQAIIDSDGGFTVEDFKQLGDKYQLKGGRSENGDDFTKASALFNAALVRCTDWSGRQELIDKIKTNEMLFLRHVVGFKETIVSSRKQDVSHKVALQKIRLKCIKRLKIIEGLHTYCSAPTACEEIRVAEKKRADAVRNLYREVSLEMKNFISNLLEECFSVLGRPPCKYAIVGLGSLARQEMTPYSDLDFAVLIEEGVHVDQIKSYFRSMTYLLHLKVLNLGETILPSMAITELNNFSDKTAAQFYDSVTPRGFAFDGCMPWASKTPLGSATTETNPGLELIMTPREMADIQTMSRTLKEGYHLADVLSKVTLIKGNESLIDEYIQKVHCILESPSDVKGITVGHRRAMLTLSEDLVVFDPTNLHGALRLDLLQGCTYDVKKMMFRLTSCLIQSLGLLLDIHHNSLECIVNVLEQKGIISRLAGHNIRVAAAIADELRMRTYLANGGQTELMSPLPGFKDMSDTTVRKRKVFHVGQYPDLLFRFFYTAYPLHASLQDINCPQLQEGFSLQSLVCDILRNQSLYERTTFVEGIIHYHLMRHDEAEACFKEVVRLEPGNYLAYLNLFAMYSFAGRYEDVHEISREFSRFVDAIDSQTCVDMAAMSSVRQQLESLLTVSTVLLNKYYGSASINSSLVSNNVPVAPESTSVMELFQRAALLSMLGDYEHAIDLMMTVFRKKETGDLSTYEQLYLSSSPYITDCFTGGLYFCLEEYDKCVYHLERAVSRIQETFGYCTAHPALASSLLYLAVSYEFLSQQEKAKSASGRATMCSRALLDRGGYTYHNLLASIYQQQHNQDTNSITRFMDMLEHPAVKRMPLGYICRLKGYLNWTLAKSFCQKGMFSKAAMHLSEMLAYMCECHKQDPDAFDLSLLGHIIVQHGIAQIVTFSRSLASPYWNNSESSSDETDHKVDGRKLAQTYEQYLHLFRSHHGRDCDIYILPFIPLWHTIDGNMPKVEEWIVAVTEMLKSVKVLPQDLQNIARIDRSQEDSNLVLAMQNVLFPSHAFVTLTSSKLLLFTPLQVMLGICFLYRMADVKRSTECFDKTLKLLQHSPQAHIPAPPLGNDASATALISYISNVQGLFSALHASVFHDIPID